MYASFLLLLFFPHDLTRDILNGIFGRGNGERVGERDRGRATSPPLGPTRGFTAAAAIHRETLHEKPEDNMSPLPILVKTHFALKIMLDFPQ